MFELCPVALVGANVGNQVGFGVGEYVGNRVRGGVGPGVGGRVFGGNVGGTVGVLEMNLAASVG